MLRYFSFPITEGSFWQTLQSSRVGDVEIQLVPDEEMLQFLCIHGSRHRWILLKWVCDVAELIRHRPNLQWSQVIEQAEALGNLRILWLGLNLANRVLDAPLPAAIQERMASDPVVERLSRQVAHNWFSPTGGDPTGGDPTGGGWREKVAVRAYLISMKERWQDRLPRYLYFYLLIPLYSLVLRFIRLVRKTANLPS